MPSDAELTLAFVAKRQGTDAMAASTWAHVLSLELGWMGPGAAKEFVGACEAAGLLQPEGDDLRVGFDRKLAPIPRGFKPSPNLQVNPGSVAPPTPDVTEVADPFRFLVSRIVDETDLDKAAVLKEVTAVQDQFGGKLSGEAAAILVALKQGLNVRPEARSALERITSSAK